PAAPVQGVPVQQAPLANPLEAQSATASPAEEISPAELEQMSALLASIMGGAQEAPMTAAPVATAPATAAPATAAPAAAPIAQAPVVPPAPAAATVA
ncbi:MAG: dihydrolipoamide succinyltransferase, partial [Candidatus Melainabacteria bacterium]|nr:dihydrolipoamide succinyltransferase [Candidatus Melainabacteria bacterium]